MRLRLCYVNDICGVVNGINARFRLLRESAAVVEGRVLADAAGVAIAAYIGEECPSLMGGAGEEKGDEE